MTAVQSPPIASAKSGQVTVRALLGERLGTANLECSDVISTAGIPYARRMRCAVRYGAFGIRPGERGDHAQLLRKHGGAFLQFVFVN